MIAPQVPLLLALLATVLMAVAIFAPERLGPPPTVSFAPPLAPAERWSAPADPFTSPSDPFVSPSDPFVSPPDPFVSPAAPFAPGWPSLVDPCAAGCDAVARLALVDALATVRAPWAEAILRRAQGDEPDPLVREAVRAALGAG